jgi:hypothetical protein
MIINKINKTKTYFFLGFLGLFLSISLEFYLGRPLLISDDLPLLNAKWLLKSFVLFISLMMLYYPFINMLKDKKFIELKNYKKHEIIVTVVFLFLSIIFVFLFILNKNLFHEMSHEDGFVEGASACFLFFSSLLFFISCIRYYNLKVISKVTFYSLFILSITFFVVGMEEISWFQRIFDVKTPDYFEKNLQNEMNFHNFNTHLTEYLYYVGAFVFLVLFPFLKIIFNEKIKKNSLIQIIIPRPLMIPLGFVACSYNFGMWNSPIIQATFFSSLIISLLIVKLNSKKIVIYAAIITLIITQVIFLRCANNYDRINEIKEFKEFFIAFAFFVYSLDVYKNISKRNLK